MPRTKKVVITEVSESENSSNSKKPRTRKVKVKIDGKTVTNSENKKPKTRSRTRKSKINNEKSYIDNGLFFEAPYIIFRMMDDTNSKDIVRKFLCPVSIGKDKIGKMTKLPDGSKVKIVDIITDEKDLVFVVDPVA